jgi:hypothetical protein
MNPPNTPRIVSDIGISISNPISHGLPLRTWQDRIRDPMLTLLLVLVLPPILSPSRWRRADSRSREPSPMGSFWCC